MWSFREAKTSRMTFAEIDSILHTKGHYKPLLQSNGTGCLVIRRAFHHRMDQSRNLMAKSNSAPETMVD